jgi:hypothetical protein
MLDMLLLLCCRCCYVSVRSDMMSLDPIVKPTRHCFSAVTTGYAKRGDLVKVQDLLLQLQSLYHASGRRDPLLYQSAATFNSVLQAYAQQKAPSGAVSAQQLLERLYSAAATATATNGADAAQGQKTSFRPCFPDTSSVITVINAWVGSGAVSDAVGRIEAFSSIG